MSFELIDNIDEKYSQEHFTRESIIKYNIDNIADKIKNKIIELEEKIIELEERIIILEKI